MLRFIDGCRKSKKIGELSLEETGHARHIIVQLIQEKYFVKELNFLKRFNDLEAGSICVF